MPPSTGAVVRLGGRSRTIRYTPRALLAAQRELGTRDRPQGPGFGEILVEVAVVSVHPLSVILWAGLLHEDPDLKVDDVVDQLEPPIEPLINGIAEGLKPWMEIEKGAKGQSARAEGAQKKGSPSQET